MNQLLQDKLKTLPNSPGVYFHKSADGEIIYVGKAAVLKNRVRQYFNNSPKDNKTTKLVQNIAITDWIETDSEIDALFLENEMIKRYKPKFNILLRDDKNNSYVRINFRDDWPTVTLTRAPLDDGAEYIGPFYGAAPVRKALRYLRKSFPYLAKPSEQDSALLKQLHLVPTGDSHDYHLDLRNLAQYLKGGRIAIQKELEKQMKRAASNLDFERAAELRNKLTNLNELRKQIIFGRDEFMDISKDQALSGVMELLCLPDIPRRIEAYDISHQSGIDVVGSMVVATNGVADKREYRKFKISRNKNDDFAAMAEVMERRFSPRHLSWGMPNLIVVDGGYPQLRAIQNKVQNIPVIGMAKENDEIVVSKTTSHLNTNRIEQLIYSPLAGVAVTDYGDYYQINLHVGAKHSAGHSFTFTGSTTINPYTDLLKLLQRLRDESHHFAITYHQSIKRKRTTSSSLDDITGVGPATRRKLLRQFGSVAGVKVASIDELATVISRPLAETIKTNLK
ncbi:MAG: excinuclease ABC subunit UvrC [Candidatus Saccharibacteria bacterium]|nr:excinuclease ABC subunit UvrC [Candidatus Saccharibacteria bacterium]